MRRRQPDDLVRAREQYFDHASYLALEQRCTYAVVLTDRLRDESGASVVSPFKAINHRDQTNDLKPMLELLPRYGLSLKC